MKKILTSIVGFFLLLSACEQPPVQTEVLVPEEETVKIFDTNEIEGVDANLDFQAEISTDWTVTYVPEISAISFLDAEGESQIFVRYFNASQFLTLTTVDIFSRVESTINGRPAVTYEIQKKSGVADFSYQPSWRNERHFVTDIRSTDEATSIFFVFAKNPTLSQEVFDDFLNSVTF